MRIENLAAGQVAHIVKIEDDGEHAREALRLRALGFDEGVEIELLHRGMIGGDPIALRLGGNVIAVRKASARLIHIVPSDAETGTGYAAEASE